MILLLSHIYDISLSGKSIGLNTEVESDKSAAPSPPAYIILDVKRSKDSTDTRYKNETENMGT